MACTARTATATSICTSSGRCSRTRRTMPSPTFDAIETVDRPKIAKALADAIQKQGRHPRLFVQVNTGSEAAEGRCAAAGETDAFLHMCREEHGLTISGLMCIPPIDDQASPHFALLAKIAARNSIAGLSMGMSADFELGIQLGATHVRVGSAILLKTNSSLLGVP